jgi:hypothetical protein
MDLNNSNDLNNKDPIENDHIENNLTELETAKVLTILQSSFTDNYLISIIIGAGNTDSDLIRHQPRYNIAFGGICLEINDDKGLFGFPYYYPSNQFSQTIDILGDQIGIIAVDWSVCCDLSFLEIKTLLNKINSSGSIYIPLRNIKTVFGQYLDDILNSSAIIKESNMKIINKMLSNSKINMEIKMNNSELLYPINKYNATDSEDRICDISYAKFTRMI